LITIKLVKKLLTFLGYLAFLFFTFIDPAFAVTGSVSPPETPFGESVTLTFNIPGDFGRGDIGIDLERDHLPGGWWDVINIKNSCPAPVGAWISISCADGVFTGVYDTSESGFSLDNTNRYAFYFDEIKIAGSGFGFSDAPSVAFTIVSPTSGEFKETDILTVVIGNATEGHRYGLYFGGRALGGFTDCTSSNCQNGNLTLNSFTIPFIDDPQDKVSVKDEDSDPQQILDVPITFRRSQLADEEICLDCPQGSRYDASKNPPQCSDASGNQVAPEDQPTCGSNTPCIQGEGCSSPGRENTTPEPCSNYDPAIGCGVIQTALGGIRTDVPGFVNRILSFVLGISGGIVLILIISAGYRLMVSSGNPERVQAAREQLTSAVVGLLFIIFSLVILQVITRDIIGIPGFG